MSKANQKSITTTSLCQGVTCNTLTHNALWGGVPANQCFSNHRSGGYLFSHPLQTLPTGDNTVSVFNQLIV